VPGGERAPEEDEEEEEEEPPPDPPPSVGVRRPLDNVEEGAGPAVAEAMSPHVVPLFSNGDEPGVRRPAADRRPDEDAEEEEEEVVVGPARAAAAALFPPATPPPADSARASASWSSAVTLLLLPERSRPCGAARGGWEGVGDEVVGCPPPSDAAAKDAAFLRAPTAAKALGAGSAGGGPPDMVCWGRRGWGEGRWERMANFARAIKMGGQKYNPTLH
jgi:hypothetical protein